MADAVTTQILLESSDRLIVKLTNISDGTGEADVIKVDVSDLTPAATRVSIEKIQYATYGMGARLLWEATADVVAFLIPYDQSGEMTFHPPIPNNAGDGITGDLALTTVGHTSGDTYTIVLTLRKH